MPVMVVSFKDYTEDRCSRGCCFHSSESADIMVVTFDSLEEAREHIVKWDHYKHRCFEEIGDVAIYDKFDFVDDKLEQWLGEEAAKRKKAEEDEILARAEEIRKRRANG